MASITVKPSRMIPLRNRGVIEYVPMSELYTVTLKDLTVDEVRALGEQGRNIFEGFKSLEESANSAPEDPPLPAAFQRRLEID